MNTYNYIFSNTFEGSLAGKPGNQQALWCYLMSKMDWEKGQIDGVNPLILSVVIGGSTPTEIQGYLDLFTAPDIDSRSPDPKWLETITDTEIKTAATQGVRLLKLDTFKYYVVKHTYYRQLAAEHARKVQNRENQKEHRNRQNASLPLSASVSTGQQPSATVSVLSAHHNQDQYQDHNQLDQNQASVEIDFDHKTLPIALQKWRETLRPRTLKSVHAVQHAVEWLRLQSPDKQVRAAERLEYAATADDPCAAFMAFIKAMGYVPLLPGKRKSL